jgi:hypothetical protein
VSTLLGKNVLGKGLLKRQEIDVPTWGGTILIRELTGAEVETVRSIAASAVKDGQVTDQANLRVFAHSLIVSGWINADGTHVLTEEEGALLYGESNQTIDTIADAIAVLSGLRPKSVEQAEKN